MALLRGPFDLDWGNNTLLDVESIDIGYEQDSEDYTTVQHSTYEIDGPIKSTVSITLLATDIPSLAAVLPQHYVADNGTMSTGETVDSVDGAIDVVANDCTTSTVYNDLTITSCGNPGSVFRLVNARTKLDSITFDQKIRKVVVKFIGEPAATEANVQFYTAGTLVTPS